MKLVQLKLHGSDSSVVINPQHIVSFSVADDGSFTSIDMIDGNTLEVVGDLAELFTAFPDLGVSIEYPHHG